MSDYSGIINIIETAIYGRDMRQAIADGFKLCQANEGGSANVDTTLTISGRPADSKTVGDKFSDLESQISSINPGLSRAEKDAILAYFAEQVEIHPSLEDAYQVIYNLWNVPVSSVTLNVSSLNLAVGMSATLKATVLPENAYDKSIIWSVEPEGIVTVAQNGTVFAISEGTATITATCGEKSAECTIYTEEINYYTVTTNFTGNVSINNEAQSVIEGYSYNAILSVPVGYVLQNVTIKMGGTDITSVAYTEADKTIYISNVNGNIEISASSVMINLYDVTYDINGVTVNPKIESVQENDELSTVLTVTNSSEYQFGTIKVMMGMEDISSTAILTSNPTSTATIYIASVTDDISIHANVVQKIGELNECSWEQISSISSAGQASNYFSVGDSKTVHLSGKIPSGGSTLSYDTFDTDIEVFILDFDHNSSFEGTNKITFCIGKKNNKLIALTPSNIDNISGTTYENYQCQFCMWPTESVGISYHKSTMHYYVLSNYETYGPMNPRPYSVMALLPLELRSVMKTTTKAVKHYSGDSLYVDTCNPYLFLPSELEVRTPGVYGPSWEEKKQPGCETRYAYFESGNGFNPSCMLSDGTISTSKFSEGNAGIFCREAFYLSHTNEESAMNRAYKLIQSTSNITWVDQRYIYPIMCCFCV